MNDLPERFKHPCYMVEDWEQECMHWENQYWEIVERNQMLWRSLCRETRQAYFVGLLCGLTLGIVAGAAIYAYFL
jgi:hypothetical protein